MSIPTIEDITAAAKASAQSRPRLGFTFLREVILAYLSTARGTEARRTAADARGQTPDAYLTDLLFRLEGVDRPQMTEADARATLVELLIRGSGPDLESGCMRWGAVFGLCEAP